MRFDHCDAFALAIPKNASESIHLALMYDWPNGRTHRVHDHKLLKDILMDGDDFTRTHYCMAILREPVERFVSAWWYLQWNTGKLERQEWNPEENRPGTHQYLNDLETTLVLLEQKVKANADTLSVDNYFRQFYDLDYVFHPQWVYCATADGNIPDYLHAKPGDELQWRVLIDGVEHNAAFVCIDVATYTTKDVIEGVGEKWHITCQANKVEWINKDCFIS